MPQRRYARISPVKFGKTISNEGQGGFWRHADYQFQLHTFIVGFCIGVVVFQFVWLQQNININTPLLTSSTSITDDSDTSTPKTCQIIGNTYISKTFNSTEFHERESIEDFQIKKRKVDVKKIRLLCIVLINSVRNLQNAEAISNTWGKRCNKIIFFSQKPYVSISTKRLNLVYLSNHSRLENSWEDTVHIWRHVVNQRFDWFLKVYDDAYVIMENLRYLLESYMFTKQPLYAGHTMKQGNSICVTNQEKPGYILNRESVRRLVTAFDKKCDDLQKTFYEKLHTLFTEDERLYKCLRDTGIIVIPPLDYLHRPLFVPNYLEYSILNEIVQINNTQQHVGLDCCSDELVIFLTKSSKEIYMSEYLVYLIPAGLNGFS